MRKYEIIFIATPDLDEDNLNNVIEKVKGWIADDKGEVSVLTIGVRNEWLIASASSAMVSMF